MFVGSILTFPSYLVVFGQGSFENSDDSSSLVQGQVSETDINSSACPMRGPLVVYMVGVVCGVNCRGEVRTELALEHLNDIYEAAFKLWGKFHDDTWFPKGVLHDVVMVGA